MKKVKDMFDLKNKVAIITGGGGLLGEKHAEALAEFGCRTILLDINELKAKKAAEIIQENFGIESFAVKCDITNKEEIEKVRDVVFEKFGRIDILINNAAIDQVKNIPYD